MHLFSFALLFRSSKKLFYRLCFKNLFLHLSLCLCVFVQSVVSTQWSTGCLVVCFPGMTSSLARGKQIIECALSDAFFSNCLIFDVPQCLNRFDYIKAWQFALTTKKSLHITFKSNSMYAYRPATSIQPIWCVT